METKKTNYNSQTRFYPLFDALGGVPRLFNLDGNFFNLKQLKTQGLNEHSIAFPSFNFMAGYLRIVKFSGLVCQTKRKEYVPCVPPVFLSVKPQIISRWVVLLAALLLWVFSAEGSQIKQIVPLADCVKSAQISLRGLRVPFHGLISRVFNTVLIAKMRQTGGAFHRSLPFFPLFNL